MNTKDSVIYLVFARTHKQFYDYYKIMDPQDKFVFVNDIEDVVGRNPVDCVATVLCSVGSLDTKKFDALVYCEQREFPIVQLEN
jgi:hypothetical protein